MKKLKAWQIILLIIFYPVGIVYLIVYLCKKSKNKTTETNQERSAPARSYDYKNSFPDDTVWINKGSKIYHSDPVCADQTSKNGSDFMPIKKAKKLGCRPCKKCCNLPRYQ